MRHLLSTALNLILSIALISGAVLLLVGCQNSRYPYPITTTRQAHPSQYDRIDIPQADLEQGLRQILIEIAQDHGPVAVERIVTDYGPVVKEALYNSGYCSIQKLSLHGLYIDIDVYFRTDQPPPTLFVEAYLQGQATPSYSVSNSYHMTADYSQDVNGVSQASHSRSRRRY